MKKFFIILLLLLTFTNLHSQAATWVQVSDYVYIDRDSIRLYVDDYGKEDSCKKIFWIKTINHDNLYEKLQGKPSHILCQMIIDKAKKCIAHKSFCAYDKKGVVVFSKTYKDFELKWDPVIPDTPGEFLFELVNDPEF